MLILLLSSDGAAFREMEQPIPEDWYVPVEDAAWSLRHYVRVDWMTYIERKERWLWRFNRPASSASS